MLKRIPEVPPLIAPHTGTYSPIWSVMIPVYNCINFLQETLESVLQQDAGLDLMQIEVVDDGSTDGDVEKLVNDIGKGRIGYFRQKENVGSLRNFETCINRSKGKYVHILHGDDRIEYGFYNEIERLFNENPDAGAAFTNYNYINGQSIKLPNKNKNIQEYSGIIPDFLYKIALKQLIQPPAIVVKRTTYETVGSFFAVHFGEDWEMWTRIASQYPVAYSPSYLASYRVNHGIGISHNSFFNGQNIKDIKTVINIIQNYLPEHSQLNIKKASLKYYAKYSIRVANSLLLYNRKAAFKQVQGAWSMCKDFDTFCWIVRFYAMYFLRYKQINKMMQNRKKFQLKSLFYVTT
jgi:glycosyltransferase involved in cell wall biosynthesis